MRRCWRGASELMQAAGAAGVEHDPKALEPLQEALEDRARRWPNDGDNWFFLAHLHMQASDHPGAARALCRPARDHRPQRADRRRLGTRQLSGRWAGDVRRYARCGRPRSGRASQPSRIAGAARHGRLAAGRVSHRRPLPSAGPRSAGVGFAPRRSGRAARPHAHAARSRATVHRSDNSRRRPATAVVDGVRQACRRWHAVGGAATAGPRDANSGARTTPPA